MPRKFARVGDDLPQRLLKRFAGNRDTDVLHVFFTLLRSDQDVLENVGTVPMEVTLTNPSSGTITVDLAEGTTTGISAADRAATVLAVVDPATEALDRFRKTFHTEAAVFLTVEIDPSHLVNDANRSNNTAEISPTQATALTSANQISRSGRPRNNQSAAASGAHATSRATAAIPRKTGWAVDPEMRGLPWSGVLALDREIAPQFRA